MTEQKNNDLRHTTSAEAANILESKSVLTHEELRVALINALERIASLERDWEEVGRACRWFGERMPKRSLVYLDPPYYVTGKGLYEDHYRHEDHAAIAEQVGSLQQHWIVSYDNVPEIEALYARYRSRSFGLRYSAQSRYEGAEIMLLGL